MKITASTSHHIVCHACACLFIHTYTVESSERDPKINWTVRSEMVLLASNHWRATMKRAYVTCPPITIVLCDFSFVSAVAVCNDISETQEPVQEVFFIRVFKPSTDFIHFSSLSTWAFSDSFFSFSNNNFDLLIYFKLSFYLEL
jgi:hypothetical protein